MNDSTPPENRYLPIAVGFFLLAAPLVVAIFLAETTTGRVTNGVAASIMVGLGLLLSWRRG
jgi:hypothetical protein